MCLVESDPRESSAPSDAVTQIPEASSKAALEILPGIDELFTDPAVRRRVGEVISRAALQGASSKS